MLRNANHENNDPQYRQAGEWFRKQRRHCQITQAELAEQAGLGDTGMIDRIERGEIAMPRTMCTAIARVFGVDRISLAGHYKAWYGDKAAA
jgi:DNA-binding XRE family transcriptional regulator